MNNVMRRSFALFLVFLMCISLMPVSAFAEEPASASSEVEEAANSDETISLETVSDEDAFIVDGSSLDTALTTDSVNAIATGVDGSDNPAISVFEINEQFNPADTFNAASVSINIDYSEPLSCGTPTIFTMNLTGISDTSQCIYRLDTIYTGSGSTREMLIDSSRVAWNDSTFGYKSSNTFEFTFLASGVYSLRFAFMDKSTTPVTTGNTEITITITDTNYPSLTEICQSVAAECCAQCSTDYEKAVWLNDWLIDNCSYDNSLRFSNPEGVLARHEGTCNSYTEAYSMLLNEVGIPNTTATGNGHIWSVIQLGGKWYQVDTTWNDNYDSTDDTARHMYFGLTDELMKLAHSDHSVHAGYECTNLEDNYFIRSEKVSQWSDPLMETIKNRIADGETEFDVSVAQNEYETYETKIKYSLAAYDLSQRITEDSNGAPCTVECSYTSKAIHISAEALTTVESGTCGDGLTWTLNSAGVLTISGTGAMYSYFCEYSYSLDATIPTAPWGQYYSSIYSVVIEEGVTSIGRSSFYNCDSLARVNIPESVTSIEGGAFTGCRSLANVSIPVSVKSIGSSVFTGCSSLTEIVYEGTLDQWKSVSVDNVNSGLDYLLVIDGKRSGCCGGDLLWTLDSAGTFTISGTGVMDSYVACSTSGVLVTSAPWGNYYSSVKHVVIEANVTSIGSWAFYNCSSLVSVSISASVSCIGDYAFSGCKSLTSVHIPDGVTCIGGNAFESCSSLTSFTIPTSVTNIGSCSVVNCYSLKTIKYLGHKYQWNSVNKGSSNSSLTEKKIFFVECTDSNGHSWSDYTSNFDATKDKDGTKYRVCDTCGSIETVVDEGSAFVNSIDAGICGTNAQWILTEDGILTLRGNGGTGNFTSQSYNDTYITTAPWGEYYALIKAVVIENNVTSIGAYAFCGCSNITDVYYTNSSGVSIGTENYYLSNATPHYNYRPFCIMSKHDLMHHDAKAATCTETGWNSYDICSRCDYSTYEKIPALGHDLIHHDAKAPTYTEVGWKEYDTCSRCDYSTYVELSVKQYVAQGVCGDSCTWTLDDQGSLTISGTGAMDNYCLSYWYSNEQIINIDTSAPWWNYHDLIKTVEIGSGVTSIGWHAFVNCSFLTSVTIPNSVTSISGDAFIGCSKLTSITVDSENTVYSSSDGIVLNKEKNQLICCPCGKSGAFVVPNSVRFIGDNAFGGCSSLTSIIIPNGVISIGSNAFNDCSSLTSITIPNSVTSIGNLAFANCSSLTSITIPKSVSSIGYRAFYCCSTLKSIVVSSENTAYCSDEGVLFNKAKTKLIRCPEGKTGVYSIPDSVTIIGEDTFRFCSLLTSITIPNSVTNIDGYSFASCSSLTDITIPDGVTTINDCTFLGCSSLTNVIIPNSVTSIGRIAFGDCSSLTSIIIPDSVTSIEEYAFTGCSSLVKLLFKGNAPSFGPGVFLNDILTAYFPAWNSTWTESVMQQYSGTVFWTAFGYGIHYANVLDSDTNPNPTFCDGTAETLLQEPGRTGYVFSGWYKDELLKTRITSIPADTHEDITIYAKWTPFSYSVVLNSNGGSGSMASLTGRQYDTDYELPAYKFTRKGYSFVEWNTQKDGSGRSFTDMASFTNLCNSNGEKVILYAQWMANRYAVHFDANGGVGYMDDQAFFYDGLQALTLNAFTKEGYAFAGWTLGSTTYKDGQSVKNLSALQNGEVTLIAQWTADKTYSGYSYVVSFDGNTSTKGTMKPQTLNIGTAKALTASSFSKTGYNFAGWALDPNGDVVFSNKEKVQDLNIKYGRDAITLYAVWQPNTYTIAFNGNGGTYIPDGTTKAVKIYTQALTYDEFGTLYSCRFSRNGYEFAGWAMKSSAKATLYSDGQEEVFNLTATNNGKTTLYAVWTPVPYNVTYALDGGTNSVSNPAEYNTTQSVSLKAATKPGYTFAGWYDDLTGKKVTSIAKGSFGNKSYTARWTINTYNVKYNANGGKGAALTVKGLKYGEEQLVVETNWFDFPGYSFVGWNTRPDCTGTTYLPGSVVDFNAKNGATVNLYAMWEYTVDLDANGGEGDVGSITLLYSHPELLPSEFIRDGFVFVGWNTNQAKASAGTAQYKSTMQVKNIGPDKTLYAVWKPITYTIKFNGNGATSGGMSTQTATYDKLLSLKANSFKRTGYSFIGWALTPDGDVEFENSEKVLNLTSTNKGIVNLYAKWKKN